ncbi:FMN-binding protein [Alkaliphilus peptidifermentans]|uniref:Ion-translocating oxidoreductase complex subunit G n=1 Tax=Alkaliphilus peptidifermentans DSM 18978 TaxID=1120976 RepID=A0A1G5CK64_9FIRM|nr:FMN-binding protein [Alkaliphilus peptidifermentans]SCY02661.1 Na+-transporting NADH:ubiquinone oxidoreductase subunit C [Alkaliphilus peptidifermentans DSM 18978]
MKKFNYKAIIFMLVISVIFTGILAIINEFTSEQVMLNQELKQQKSLLYVLDFPTDKQSATEVSSLFNNNIIEQNTDDFTYYEGYKNDLKVGYIFPIEGEAVWGTLKGFIALSPDFNEIIGVDFISHSETPGLGGRIDETQFKEQFRGIEIDHTKEDEYILYRPHPDGQVDSITGATGTSNAVRRILNNNLNDILKEKGGLSND